MKKIVMGLLILLIGLQSCTSQKKNETATATQKSISDLSIYNLPSQWTTQDNKNIEMKDLKGKVLVMVMIYTSCKSACPRLVADMRHIEERIPENLKDKVKLNGHFRNLESFDFDL
mgnify:CR=1 FL=1